MYYNEKHVSILTIIAISTMTSPTDINVPTRGALVLETKASFLLLRFVNSDVSYYGHRISEKKKRKRKHGKFACKINSGERKPVVDRSAETKRQSFTC